MAGRPARVLDEFHIFHAILIALIAATPGNGIDLVKRVRESKVRKFWKAHRGSVYLMLQDLEASGYLRSSHVDKEDSPHGHARTVYSLTPLGQALAEDVGDAFAELTLF